MKLPQVCPLSACPGCGQALKDYTLPEHPGHRTWMCGNADEDNLVSVTWVVRTGEYRSAHVVYCDGLPLQ